MPYSLRAQKAAHNLGIDQLPPLSAESLLQAHVESYKADTRIGTPIKLDLALQAGHSPGKKELNVDDFYFTNYARWHEEAIMVGPQGACH